jgi:hypothetical protein
MLTSRGRTNEVSRTDAAFRRNLDFLAGMAFLLLAKRKQPFGPRARNALELLSWLFKLR